MVLFGPSPFGRKPFGRQTFGLHTHDIKVTTVVNNVSAIVCRQNGIRLKDVQPFISKTLNKVLLDSFWCQCYKTFYCRYLLFFVVSLSVYPWKAFSVNELGRSLLSLRTFPGLYTKSSLLDLPVNIRLGWEGLQLTNSLAYYENL